MNGGVLLIDKPVGPTSHDIVGQVRRKLQTRRVGHAGTLDPLASGLLLVCVEDATKVLEYMTAADKAYEGEVVLGIATDTDDAGGQITATKPVTELSEEAVAKAATLLTGTIDQVVPAYSAVHIDGKRAYELARAGKQVEMPSREVHISAFGIHQFHHDGEFARAHFTVKCSKGTYVRAICRDLGKQLNMPAHMASLRRTAIGSASLSGAVPMQSFLDSEGPHSYLKEPLQFLEGYPQIDVTKNELTRLANGQRVSLPDTWDVDSSMDESIVLICYVTELAAIAVVVNDNGERWLQPKKVFWKRG